MRGRDVAVMAVVAVLAAVLVQAGPLNPPAGPVASSYKTLSEVEPGIPLSSVPGGQSATHVITQPGRYYLTGNMTGVVGQYGVIVTAPDVTIDLCGFTLQGVPGSFAAIWDSGSTANVTVMNGTIRGWGRSAVDSPLSVGWVCRGLRVWGGAFDGIVLGTGVVVENCQVNGTTNMGIVVGPHSRVTRCTVGSCQRGGINAGLGARVESCVLFENLRVGIEGGVGVTVSDTTVTNTRQGSGSGTGIILIQNGIVERCVVQWSEGHGVYSDQGGTIIQGCKVDSNKGDGINVYNSSRVENNEVHANGSIAGGATTTAGIRVRGMATRVDGNHLVSNNTAVKIEGTGNLVSRNSFSANGAHVAGGAGNSVAQIVQSPANGFAISDPWANLNY